MTGRRSLPPGLLGGPFAVASALDLGVSESRLQALDLARPFHGVRSLTADTDLASVCAALATRFRPGDAFTGPTAAMLWGMPLPLRLSSGDPIFVSSRHPVHPLRRPGVAASLRFEAPAVELAGIPVLSPLRTCLSLGTMLTADDLTAVLDFVLDDHLHLALADTDRVRQFVIANGHVHGIAKMRIAAEQARTGAWSRPETLLRLLVARAGLPTPVLNRGQILSGERVIPDLSWPDYRVAVEYNGAHHDESNQRVKDLRRVDLFTDAGWLTVNAARAELFRAPIALADRIADRLRSRGWDGRVRRLSPKSVSWTP